MMPPIVLGKGVVGHYTDRYIKVATRLLLYIKVGTRSTSAKKCTIVDSTSDHTSLSS